MIDKLSCCFKILPLQLTEAITDYEKLCQVIKKVNDLIENVNNNSDLLAKHDAEIKELQNMVNYLNGELVKITNGEYMEVYIDALAKWIDRNLQQLVARIVKQVFFGLGGPGNAYFVAYIPESWNDITFDTIMTCGDPNWGHIVLKY